VVAESYAPDANSLPEEHFSPQQKYPEETEQHVQVVSKSLCICEAFFPEATLHEECFTSIQRKAKS
jgi:hypothetical protein